MNDMPQSSDISGSDEKQSQAAVPPSVGRRSKRPLILLALVIVVLVLQLRLLSLVVGFCGADLMAPSPV